MMASRVFSVLGAVSKGRVISTFRNQQDKIQARCFSKITAPSSRRRRSADPVVKAEVQEEQRAEDQKWDIDFDTEVNKLLSQVNDAVIPMIPLNPGFAVVFVPEEQNLTIITEKGKLTFTANKEQSLISLQSFLSGGQNYYFDAEVRQWLSHRDQHSLRGLVTRDLIRHNRGCPDLDEKP